MQMGNLIDELYNIYNDYENQHWKKSAIGNIQRYTWKRYYALSKIQFCRILLEYYLIRDSDILPTGTRNMGNILKDILSKYDAKSFKPIERHNDISDEFIDANPELGQFVCDMKSRIDVSNIICRDFPFGADVIFLGDDDLVSSALADENYKVTIVDVDNRIKEIVQDSDYIKYYNHDIRKTMNMSQKFNAVVLDPADGSVALSYWVRQSISMLDSEDGNRIYLSVNRWRLGKRWKSLILSYLKHDIAGVCIS